METIYERALDDCQGELEDIRKYINTDDNNLDSKTPYLIRYAVIKASGTIEFVFKGLIVDKISAGASKEVRFYWKKNIQERGDNPSTQNIKGLLAKFGGGSGTAGTWANKFTTNVNQENKTNRPPTPPTTSTTSPTHDGNLDSLVKLRNSFAHGGNINPSIEDIITYFQSGRTILKCLDAALK